MLRAMSVWAGCAVLFILLLVPQGAWAFERVNSERSLTRPTSALGWRLAASQPMPVASVRYPEISIQRIHEVSRKNSLASDELQQVGIGRWASRESPIQGGALRWIPLRGGGSVARLEFTSPLALALRVGLRVDALDPRVELRFAGSDRPNQVVAKMGAAQMRRLASKDRIFWTPSTDGQTQLIEIYRPAHVPEHRAILQSVALSHLLGNSRNSFILSKALGEADTCQIDTTCKVEALGPDFVEATKSTALLQFVSIKGDVLTCTITLLADKVASSQIPYAVSRWACGAPTLTDRSGNQVAGTINTFWGYESTACGSGVARTPVQLTGGAVQLYTSLRSDTGGGASFIRLNDPAPAGAVFSGWDTSPLTIGERVVSIHHAQADVKKVVVGAFRGTSADAHHVGWIGGGYLQGGSLGAGLFTTDVDGYHLRGFGALNYLICARTYLLSTPGNTQPYGRMDFLYPYVRQFLAPNEVAPAPDFDFVVDGRTVVFTARVENTFYAPEWYPGGNGQIVDGTVDSRDLGFTYVFDAPGNYVVRLKIKGPGHVDHWITHVVPVGQVRVNGTQPRIPRKAVPSLQVRLR